MIANIHRDLLLFFDGLFERLLFKGFRFIEIFFQQREQHRVEHNGEDRPRQHQILSGLRQQVQCHAQTRQNKGEFTNLCQAGGDGQCRTRRVAEHSHQEEGSD